MPAKEKQENDILKNQNEIRELKDLILKEEKKVLHLKKHWMNDKIIELIKARIK